MAAVIVIAGGIVGLLQWDKARQLAREELALAHAQANILGDIVTASYDKTARIWDATTAKEIAVLRGHETVDEIKQTVEENRKLGSHHLNLPPDA